MTLKRGDTEVLIATAYLGNAAYSDLASASDVRWGAKSLYTVADASAEIVKSVSGGGISVTSNVATIEIQPADWAAVPYRTQELYWELQVVSATAKVYTVASGIIRLEPDVVRETS